MPGKKSGAPSVAKHNLLVAGALAMCVVDGLIGLDVYRDLMRSFALSFFFQSPNIGEQSVHIVLFCAVVFTTDPAVLVN